LLDAANLKGNQNYIKLSLKLLKLILREPLIWHLRYFANRSLQGEGGVDYQMTDSEVQKVIKRKVDESVESAFGV
jgi:SecD/SecF fusion protein